METHRNIPLPPHPLTGVTADSRRVQPGMAFVAIAGTRVDGHRFIADALRRGAACIYSERPLPAPFPVPCFQVHDARKALAVLVAHFYGNPAERLRCLGATGTNGKTTTTTLLQWILNTPIRRAGLMGTVHIDNGDTIEAAQLTTADAETLHAGLATMVQNGLRYAVLEVSSHGLKQHRVYGIPFRVGIYTNLSPDHSDFHPSLDDYIDTKATLFSSVVPDGALVVNGDDPYSHRMITGSAATTFTYSSRTASASHADVHITRMVPETGGMRLTLRLSAKLQERVAAHGVPVGEGFAVWTPLLGRHNAANVVAAVTGALAEGIDPAQIARGVATFPGVWRRQQRLLTDGPTVIDDCCHNPDSYRALFETIRYLSAERILLIHAIRGSRGEAINRAIAQVVAEWAANQSRLSLWITECTDTAGPYDRVTDEERTAVLDEFARVRVPFRYCTELRSALREMTLKIEREDVAVLAGAHAMDTAGSLFLDLWAERAVS